MIPASFSLTTTAPGTLGVSGALTFATAASALETARAELDRSGQTTLDLSGVTHADSAGLATLLALLAHARTKGKTLSVANTPEGLQALARVSGVEALL
ncbi:phospholipid transport system transporter-binding protein [Luteibacter sp. OK325]|uniref:STAS domain-containing protein n=1 Tax=Luteibacter sp. OK325 TaxID=2135670 RepID=UPI000D393509|nr:STAS domain-containing protein [Luteibacter sp. OK325]PTR23954.1 phospholipid transport system transporter-binding protein [Luteibacter sp. OK325]